MFDPFQLFNWTTEMMTNSIIINKRTAITNKKTNNPLEFCLEEP